MVKRKEGPGGTGRCDERKQRQSDGMYEGTVNESM